MFQGNGTRHQRVPSAHAAAASGRGGGIAYNRRMTVSDQMQACDIAIIGGGAAGVLTAIGVLRGAGGLGDSAGRGWKARVFRALTLSVKTTFAKSANPA